MIKGSGIARSEERGVERFGCVDLHVPADANIKRGEVQVLRITADDNVLPLIATVVEKGTLRIIATANFKPATAILVEIESPMISGVKVQGSGNVNLDGATDKELSLLVNGSGNIKAHGTVETLKAVSNGSGNLMLKHLVAKTGHIATNGSGNAEINVTATLSATISSSGNIISHGSPGTVMSRKAGSGEFIVRGN